MAMKQLEYVISSGATVDTGIVLGTNYSVEVDYCCFQTYSSDWTYRQHLFGDVSGGIYVQDYQGAINFNHGGGTFNYHPQGFEGSFWLKNESLAINQENVYTKSYNSYSTSQNFYFFTLGRESHRNVYQPVKLGITRLYDPQDVLIGEFIPVMDENNVVCFYDSVNEVYRYPNGELFAGPLVHKFFASQSKLSFQSIQSSQNITITAETGWTATTNNSWISLSQNTGSTGDTNVTVTVADGSHDGSRVGKITFTDADNYTFDVDVFQLKLGMKVYVNRYKVGSTNIVKQQSGDDNVKKMYIGNDLVYQKFAFSPKLSISVDSMEFKCSGDTAQTVTVNSNTNWNYITDANWLTLTKDGNTLCVLPDDYTSELENRTTTITITADNGDIVKTKTISVTQKKVSTWEPVDYVYTNSEAYVDTTIRPTTNTKFTVKLKQTGRNGGGTVGYFMSNTPITCENDSTDYRCFNYDRTNGFVWDFNNSRISGNISPESDGLIIATFGNNYIADKNETKVATGSTQSSIATQRNVPIYINLDNTYAQIQQVTIYDNDVVVFDGYAADVDGDYGIYDTVSETLLKPTNGATVYKGTW